MFLAKENTFAKKSNRKNPVPQKNPIPSWAFFEKTGYRDPLIIENPPIINETSGVRGVPSRVLLDTGQVKFPL